MYYAITMPKNHIAIIVPSLVNQMLRGGIRLPPPLPLLYAGNVARPTAGVIFADGVASRFCGYHIPGGISFLYR
jgi:hypothetical protein